MKKRLFFVIMLCIAFGFGCSMMLKKDTRSIEGIWTAVHESGANIIIEFKKDKSMSFTVKEYPEYSFRANYEVDFSTDPISVDFINMEPSGNIGNTCLAIIQYSSENELKFHGKFGKSGEIERPSKFDEYTTIPEVYLNLKKSVD